MNQTEYYTLIYKLSLAVTSHKRGKEDEGLRELEKVLPLIDKLLEHRGKVNTS